MMRQVPRVSIGAMLLASAALLLGIAATVEAGAHHPGSHAWRQSDGRVRLEAVATATDGCTAIVSVDRGTPQGMRAPRSSEPVVVRLRRAEGAPCTTVLRTIRREAVLDEVPAEVQNVHVFVLEPDGRVGATERVPIH